MTEVVVTRGGQITLTRDVREKLQVEEGDMVMVNVVGETAVVTKKDPRAFAVRGFLPADFETTIKRFRAPASSRLRRLGIVPG